MLTPRADLKTREAGPYSRHLPALDGLRGLAILGVMASHLFVGAPSSNPVIHAVQASFLFGATGVELFFVLSGFLITGILFDSLGDNQFFRKFYARRCLRIFPLYYGTLLLCLVLIPVTHQHWDGALLSSAFYLQNTTIILPYFHFPETPLTLRHFWSLAVEEQFYLVWPFLVYFIRDLRKLLWTCAGLSVFAFLLRYLLVSHFVEYSLINANTLCRADSLLMGGFLSLILRSSAHDRVLPRGPWVFAAGAIASVLLALARSAAVSRGVPSSFWSFSFSLGYTLLALTYTGLILWSLKPSFMQRVFSLPVLRFLGKYSYGLYVLHLLAFPFEQTFFRDAIARLTSNKVVIIAGTGIASFAIALVLAVLSYNLFEKQFLRLKRFFDYNRPAPVA